MTYDVIIAGVGAMGSAAAYHLASRGLRVLAIERFLPGHEFGSSHGLTRIIRLAYFEHPSYVPLLRRAFELWRDLESVSRERLLYVTGALDAGREDGRVVAGSLQSCREHELPHEVLDAAALQRRFPGWHPPPELIAVFQPDGGFLVPEHCIAAHVAGAAAAAAEFRFGERLTSWRASAGTVHVVTDLGSYDAGQLVLTAGAWMGSLAPTLSRLVVPERQVLGWFGVTERALFTPTAFPVFILDADEGIFYGFPEHEIPGFKIGKYHHRYEIVDPDAVDRTCHDADEVVLRQAVERYFPLANGELVRARACLFTNTPDEHFIVDRDPAASEVLLVSPCSGHGFKFSSVIGEIVADLIEHGRTGHDIALFKLDRFGDAAARYGRS